MNPITVTFEDTLELHIQPDTKYEWLLTNEEVAKGYGVTVQTLRSTKSRHTDELAEVKHWVSVANRNGDVVKGRNGGSALTLWTKRGVVRLGFFIRSERAKKFRDFCEDLVISELEQPKPSYQDLYNAMPIRALPEKMKELQAVCYASACATKSSQAFQWLLLRESFGLHCWKDLPIGRFGEALTWFDEHTQAAVAFKARLAERKKNRIGYEKALFEDSHV